MEDIQKVRTEAKNIVFKLEEVNRKRRNVIKKREIEEDKEGTSWRVAQFERNSGILGEKGRWTLQVEDMCEGWERKDFGEHIARPYKKQ